MGIARRRRKKSRKGSDEERPVLVTPAPVSFTQARLNSALAKFVATRTDDRLYVGGGPKGGYLVAHGHAGLVLRFGGDDFEGASFKVNRTKLTVEFEGGRVHKATRLDAASPDEFQQDEEAKESLGYFRKTYVKEMGKADKVVNLVSTGSPAPAFVCVLKRLVEGGALKLCYALQSPSWGHTSLVKADLLDAVLAVGGKSVLSGGWRITSRDDDASHENQKGLVPPHSNISTGFRVEVASGDLTVDAIIMPVWASDVLGHVLEHVSESLP